MKHFTYILINDKNKRYAILQCLKSKEELEKAYKADEIKKCRSIKEARTHSKGYALDDYSGFYK